MWIDERLEFSDSGDWANEAGTANVGDVIDLGIAARNPGNGEPLYLVVTVETAADGGAGGNGTTAFQLVSDGVASPATDGNQTIHFTSDVFTAAQLPANRVFVWPLPISGLPYERYLGMQIVQATEGEDDLVCSAFLTVDPHGWVAYPDATN